MPKKILVVDDDGDDLNTISIILEKEGFEVDVAQDGACGFDAATKNNYDLILLDILMPVLSGYDLLKLLRENLNKSQKIAYVSIVQEKEANLNEADGFIQKPFSPKEFLQKVENLI